MWQLVASVDERVIGAATLGEQAAGKVKDLLSGSDEGASRG